MRIDVDLSIGRQPSFGSQRERGGKQKRRARKSSNARRCRAGIQGVGIEEDHD